MASISIKIVDHSDEVLQALGQQSKAALLSVGATAESYAKKQCPVDTGLLRNSITHALSGQAPVQGSYKANKGTGKGAYKGKAPGGDNAVYIGSNVEYAVVVEYGDMHHKVGKKHFLRDAVIDHKEQYKAIIQAALEAQG